MARYEQRDDDGPGRFWEIERVGRTIKTAWGRLGNGGRSKIDQFGSDDEAERASLVQVRLHLDQGYYRVDGEHHPEFEARLAEQPDDIETYAVYADWLQERGDPRGELMACQVAIASGDDSERTARAMRQLLDHHDYLFTGDLTPVVRRGHLNLDWFCGFIRGVAVRIEHDPDAIEPDEAIEILERIVTHPSSRLLRELKIWHLASANEELTAEIVAALRDGPPARHVRALALEVVHRPPRSEREEDGSYGDWFGDPIDLSFDDALPQLGEVRLSGDRLALYRVDLPTVHTLELSSDTLPFDSVNVIAAAAWPALRRLHIRSARDADKLCRRLADSPIGQQLETLQLSGGALGDATADVLIDRRRRFSRLRQLVAPHNPRLSPARKLALKRTFSGVSYLADDG